MQNRPSTLILSLFLLSCNEGHQPLSSTVDNDRVEELYDREKTDSACEDILEKVKEEVESEKNQFRALLVLILHRRGLNMTICVASILPLRMIWMITV